MSIAEIIGSNVGIILIILSLIQITPISCNPWSKIARGLGRALTVEVMEKLDKVEVDEARYRIIRFDDEVRHSTRHTEEHFNQILDDINAYEKYCQKHPEYPNRKAVSAIKNIDEVYQKCKKDKDFLV